MVGISIIVPVFNVEKYLKECIQSVLNQTFQQWELLLIDDGSKDSSPDICDYYASLDNRIKVIHKKNEGVSIARNVGLDLATGTYIIFLDSDDYWYDATALEQLFSAAQSNDVDLIRGEYKAVNEKGEDLFLRPVSDLRNSYAGRLLDSSDFIQYAINGEFFLVLTLIRSSVIKDIRFTPNRIFLEDMLFYSQLCLKDLRCMYVPSIRFYAYRKNLSSVSFKANPQKLSDSFSMCDIFHCLSVETHNDRLRSIYQKYSVSLYFSTLETLASDEYYKDCREYIQKFDLINLQKRVYRWMKDTGVQIRCLFVCVSPFCHIRVLRVRYKLALLKNKLLRRK